MDPLRPADKNPPHLDPPKLDSKGRVIPPPPPPPPPTPVKPEKPWLGRIVVLVAVAAGIIAVTYGLYELCCYAKEVAADKFSKETDEQLESAAHQRGLGDLVGKIKQIKNINQRLVFKRLSKCTAHEVKVLSHLDSGFAISTLEIKEILMGAHVRLNDKGATCKEWAALEGVKNRISSHRSDGMQYSIRGKMLKEILFATISVPKEGATDTWLQFESNPVSLGSVIRHGWDYVQYKISGANQGPFGASFITDQKPLRLEPRLLP